LLAALGLVFAPTIANAQSTLGEILDAGAKKITAADFKRDVVQRALVGATNAGASLEVMYAANGSIAGRGADPLDPQGTFRPVSLSGTWTIDETDRVCAAMRAGPVIFPQRCQFWFKLDGAYFISDSDSDRRAAVLRRTVQQASGPITVPSNLGELLDAGGRRLSAAEFKREVTQHTLVGLWESGGGIEMKYAANGAIQGLAQPSSQYAWSSTVNGEWTIREGEKVCTTMQISGGTNQLSVPSRFPLSCQTWFKLGDDYFVSDSDSDRRAKVVRRTVKIKP